MNSVKQHFWGSEENKSNQKKNLLLQREPSTRFFEVWDRFQVLMQISCPIKITH